MRKSKKAKIKSLVIITIVVAVGIILTDVLLGGDNVITQSIKHEDFNNPLFTQTSNFFALDFTNYLYPCEQKTEMYRVTGNVPTLVSSDYDSFNTIIKADVVQRNTGEKIDDLRADTWIRCDHPNSGNIGIESLKLTNGNALYLIQSNTDLSSGGSVTLTNSFKPISTKTFGDNQWVQVASHTIHMADVEGQLKLDGNEHTYITFYVTTTGTMTAVFEQNQGSQVAQIPNVQSKTSYVVKVLEGTTTPDPVNDDAGRADVPIFIDDILQTKPSPDKSVKGGLTLNIDEGAQILIKATMRQYKSSDGLPTVRITGQTIGGSPVNVKINLGLDTITGGDGKFSNTYLLPRESTGTFTLKLEHPFRNTSDTETFVVDNTTREPPPDENAEEITATAKAKFHYVHRFQNVPVDDQLRTVTTSGVAGGTISNIKLDISDTVLVNSQKIEGRLSQIQLTSIVGFDSAEEFSKFKRADSSSTTYQATIEIDGKSINFKPFSRNNLATNNLCQGSPDACQDLIDIDSGMALDEVVLSHQNLIDKIAEIGDIKQDGQDLKLRIEATGGDFKLLDINNDLHAGSVKGIFYEHTFKFGSTPVEIDGNDGSCNDPTIPCECPEGQILDFSEDLGKVVCADPDTNTPTGDKPTGDTSNPQDGNTDQYCKTNSDGDVIATYGTVSISDPGCENLFGDTPPEGTPEIEGDVDGNPNGNDKNTVVVDCGEECDTNIEDVVNKLNESFGEVDLTLVFVLLGVLLVIIITIAIVRKRRKR